MRFSEWEFTRGDKRKLRSPLIELAARVGVDASAIVQRFETQRKQTAAAEKKAAAAAAKVAKKAAKGKGANSAPAAPAPDVADAEEENGLPAADEVCEGCGLHPDICECPTDEEREDDEYLERMAE